MIALTISILVALPKKSKDFSPPESQPIIIGGEIGGDIELKDFRIEAITGGSNALAEVIVGVAKGGRIVTARGVREDIVMASVEAIINAVNRLMQK